MKALSGQKELLLLSNAISEDFINKFVNQRAYGKIQKLNFSCKLHMENSYI